MLSSPTYSATMAVSMHPTTNPIMKPATRVVTNIDASYCKSMNILIQEYLINRMVILHDTAIILFTVLVLAYAVALFLVAASEHPAVSMFRKTWWVLAVAGVLLATTIFTPDREEGYRLIEAVRKAEN